MTTTHPYAEVIDLMDRAARPDPDEALAAAVTRADAIATVAEAIEGLTLAPAATAAVAVDALIDAGLLDP